MKKQRNIYQDKKNLAYHGQAFGVVVRIYTARVIGSGEAWNVRCGVRSLWDWKKDSGWDRRWLWSRYVVRWDSRLSGVVIERMGSCTIIYLALRSMKGFWMRWSDTQTDECVLDAHIHIPVDVFQARTPSHTCQIHITSIGCYTWILSPPHVRTIHHRQTWLPTTIP